MQLEGRGVAATRGRSWRPGAVPIVTRTDGGEVDDDAIADGDLGADAAGSPLCVLQPKR